MDAIFSELEKPQQTLHCMLKYKSLPQHIEALFIHNILKIFSHILQNLEKSAGYDAILELCDAILEKMNESIKSAELEVQERASLVVVLTNIIKEEILTSKFVRLRIFYASLV